MVIDMKIHLGYVASPLSLDNITYSHTMTYKTYSKLTSEDSNRRLREIINRNLYIFDNVINYNHINEVYFYRMSPNIIPLATHDKVNFDYLLPFSEKFNDIGKKIKRYRMRVDTHLDQYCVLNSVNEKVVEISIKQIEYHYNLFKLLGINGKAIIHVGSGKDNKEESVKRFITNFKKLPDYLKDIIILENDDKIFTFEDTLAICKKLNIPMVLDYHHYKCNNKKKLTTSDLKDILSTWKDTKLKAKIHFSSPKSRKDKRSHHNYIDEKEFIKFLDLLKKIDEDVDIMLECKMRDMALFKLVRQLKCHSEYTFINETTFKL